MRHFRTPSGGLWTATCCPITHCTLGPQTSIAISGSVLRFTSEDGVTFDLEDWPSDWMQLNDASLSGLLRHAALLMT